MSTSKKKIVVIVAADGAVSIDMIGYTGTACTDASAFLELALGTTADRRVKPEWFQHDQRDQQQERRV